MRRENMTQCECDRCGEKELLAPDAPTSSNWHDMKRYTVDGTVKPFLLCQGCYEKYRDFADGQDRQLSLWLEMKEV